MNCLIQCDICGHRCWTKGHEETDTNAIVLDDNDPLDEGCEHMKAGEAVTIIEWEHDQYNDGE